MSVEIHNLITSAKTVGMLQHDEEIISLSTFVAALQPKRVMEIGSWKGGVFKILSSIAKELAISVDLDAYGDLPGTMEERNAMFRSWGEHIHPLVGDSHSMGTYRAVHSLVGNQQLDFLMIDGDHSYEGVKQDYFMYSPFVRSGGWIAFHDINDSQFHRERNCYVFNFGNELQGNKVVYTLNKQWGGIGLIQMP